MCFFVFGEARLGFGNTLRRLQARKVCRRSARSRFGMYAVGDIQILAKMDAVNGDQSRSALMGHREIFLGAAQHQPKHPLGLF